LQEPEIGMFSRPAKDRTSSRYYGLDSLRALAIGLVMLFHLQEFLPRGAQRITGLGWIGVDLFFVLSGYLIGSQLLRPYAEGKIVRPTAFYRRRFYRILPAYLVVLLLYLLVPVWREAPKLAPAWQFFTFTWNLVVSWGQPAFSHVWSLCIEEHFYLLLPLLVLWLMHKPSLRKAGVLFGVIVAGGILARTFIFFHELRPLRAEGYTFAADYLQTIHWPTYTRLDGLAVGVALAGIKLFKPQWWHIAMKRGHALLVGGIACLGVAVWLYADLFSTSGRAAAAVIAGFPLLAMGFGLCLLSSVSANGFLAKVRLPGAKMTAMLAYSLYLTHKEIIHLDRLYFPSLTAKTWIALPFAVVTCFMAASLLYFAVERPFLLMRDSSERKRIPKVEQLSLVRPAA
jgi:peptidoglycan/LPS O-acetylase OafA/YrhL